jgi:ankyrin repeat protein
LFEILLELVDLNAKSPGNEGVRPIHAAARMGNIKALDRLLSLGVSIETQDTEGLTPIFYAVQSKSIETLNYLRSKKANIFHVEKQGRSLFYWAASLGSIEMLDILILDGMDPNQATILGRTALSKSAWNGSVEVLTYLLNIPGLEIDTPDKRGRAPLHNAVWGSAGGREGRKMGQNATDSPECAELLIKKGCKLEAEDNGGNTPLCIACSTYSPRSVELLLKYNANPSHTNHAGYNPYHQALARGNIDCAEIMVRSGSDINCMSKKYSPIQICIKYTQLESLDWLISKGIFPNDNDICLCVQRSTPEVLLKVWKYLQNSKFVIEYAMTQGKIECATWIINNNQVNKEAIVLAIKKDKKLGELALKQLKEPIDHEILEAMIDSKIDTAPYLEKAVPNGRILRLAIKQFNLVLSLKILEKFPDLACESDSYSGNTALHIACISGLSDLIPKLISLSAEPISYISKSNNKGLTPITLAQVHKHLYISEMLKDMITQSTHSKSFSQVKSLEYKILEQDLSLHPMADFMPKGYWRTSVPTKDILNTDYLWIDDQENLMIMVNEIQGINVIGVDLEYHVFEQKKGCICLIQISTGEKDYIIDALANRENVGNVIRDLMFDSNVLKVLHGPDSDLLWLQNDFDAHPVRVFDTARAHKLVSNSSQLSSLAKLLSIYFDLVVDKSFQVAEWRIRPLPLAMIQYARNDAHYLPGLMNKLMDELDEGQLDSLSSLCNAMCTKSPKNKLIRLEIIT